LDCIHKKGINQHLKTTVVLVLAHT